MRKIWRLGLAASATLLFAGVARAGPLVPLSGTHAGECTYATGTTSNWTCVKSNFNGTNASYDEYMWLNMHFTKVTGLPSTGGTVYFQNQYVTIVDGSANIHYVAVPDGSVTFVNGTVTPTLTYDATGWHTTVSLTEASKSVFAAGLAYQIPAAWGSIAGANPVSWEGKFSYNSALSGPIGMSWQWSAAAYECDKSGATAAQIAACDAAFANTITGNNALGVAMVDGSPVNGAVVGEPTNFSGLASGSTNFVVGGLRGGGASNATGSWSGTATIDGSPYTPPDDPPTVTPEPATMGLLGLGLMLVAARVRKHKRSTDA